MTQDELIQEHYSKQPFPYFLRGFVKNVIRVGLQGECSVLETSMNTNAWTAARETAEDHSCVNGPERAGRCMG